MAACWDCDGVGWVEGGETLQTTCPKCDGTGIQSSDVVSLDGGHRQGVPADRAAMTATAGTAGRKGRLVKLTVDGETQIHAADIASGSYLSLCGIGEDTGGDCGSDVTEEPAPRGATIDCPHCIQLWAAWRQFKPRDFAKESPRAR